MYNPKYIYIEGHWRTYKLTPEGEQMFNIYEQLQSVIK